jgi:hypothetical protein
MTVVKKPVPYKFTVLEECKLTVDQIMIDFSRGDPVFAAYEKLTWNEKEYVNFAQTGLDFACYESRVQLVDKEDLITPASERKKLEQATEYDNVLLKTFFDLRPFIVYKHVYEDSDIPIDLGLRQPMNGDGPPQMWPKNSRTVKVYPSFKYIKSLRNLEEPKQRYLAMMDLDKKKAKTHDQYGLVDVMSVQTFKPHIQKVLTDLCHVADIEFKDVLPYLDKHRLSFGNIIESVSTPTFQYLANALGCNVRCRATKETAIALSKFTWVLNTYGLDLFRGEDDRVGGGNVRPLPCIEEFTRNTKFTVDEIIAFRIKEAEAAKAKAEKLAQGMGKKQKVLEINEEQLAKEVAKDNNAKARAAAKAAKDAAKVAKDAAKDAAKAEKDAAKAEKDAAKAEKDAAKDAAKAEKDAAKAEAKVVKQRKQ